MEAEDRRIDAPLLGFFFKLGFEGARPGEDEQDVIPMSRVFHRLQQLLMGFLGRVPGGIDDDELALIFNGTVDRFPLESLLDPVGDDIGLRVETVDLLEQVMDELRRIMDGFDFGEQGTIQPGIDQLIGRIEVLHLDMIGEVLGLGMEGGRTGDPEGMGIVAGFAREHPAEIEMDDVAAFERLLQRA